MPLDFKKSNKYIKFICIFVALIKSNKDAMVKKIYYVLSGICLLCLSVGMAQTTYVVRGKVHGDKGDRRLSSVMISGFSGEYYAVTDEQGVFQFRLPGGR